MLIGHSSICIET